MTGARDVRRMSPTDRALGTLFERHISMMRASSPPESTHTMEPGDLEAAGVVFVVGWREDAPVAMGALKALGAGEGEVKAMHVAAERRGEGWADAVFDALLASARDMELSRLYLETGSQDAFAPARAFYRRRGFVVCGPFGAYGPDPNSTFMTTTL